jgi:hypothetical protein
MYSVYWNKECWYDNFMTEGEAIKEVARLINDDDGEYVAVGTDNGTHWWLVKFANEYGVIYYEVITVRKN